MPGAAARQRRRGSGGRAQREERDDSAPLALGGASPVALTLPSLSGVPDAYDSPGTRATLAALAITLLECDLAEPADWEAAKDDPAALLSLTLQRWIRDSGLGPGASHLLAQFRTAFGWDFGDSEAAGGATRVYLSIESEEPEVVYLGRAIHRLERIHPRLPATLHDALVHGLWVWVPVWSWRAMLEEVEEVAQMDHPTVRTSAAQRRARAELPASLVRRKALGAGALRRVIRGIEDPLAREVMELALELRDTAAQQALPPWWSDPVEVGDLDSPWAGYVLAVTPGDDTEHWFGYHHEGNGQRSGQLPPTILPLSVWSHDDARRAHREFTLACRAFATAGQIFRLLERL